MKESKTGTKKIMLKYMMTEGKRKIERERKEERKKERKKERKSERKKHLFFIL